MQPGNNYRAAASIFAEALTQNTRYNNPVVTPQQHADFHSVESSFLGPREVRQRCRTGEHTGPTCGLAPGYVQANLVICRVAVAGDFAAFCRMNPRPCPQLEMTAAGSFEPKDPAPGADLRTDVPRYRVLRDGISVDRPTSITHLWQNDFVAFLLGCSFTFERALIEAGLPVRHIEQGRNVPMYRTHIECKPAGPFRGPLVVSMRPMTPSQAEQAARITEQFPLAHGGPIHLGDPSAIGISDLHYPDYGDSVTIRPGEIPVFWACGVTPMEAILQARLDLAITHEPGHMFVTDIPE